MKMRWLIGMMLLAALVSLAWAILLWAVVPRDREAIDPLAPRQLLTVQRIQTLALLTTLKVDVADAQVTSLQGRTGGVQAVLLIRGEVTIGVDLAAARFEQVEQSRHRAVLVMPQPRVQSIFLDHERTKLIGVFPAGLWEFVPRGQEADTAAVNRAYRDAQRALSAVAGDPALLERSRKQAGGVLRAFFSALGGRSRSAGSRETRSTGPTHLAQGNRTTKAAL